MDQRIHIDIRGAVQGVGFRPFIYRLATGLDLKGWVKNSPQGVSIEAEGDQDVLQTFLFRIEREHPPRSFIQSLEFSFLDPAALRSFEIRESDTGGESTAIVLSDIATCPDCLSEIFDPANRRYGYPFTNCTNCGPRFTIIESLPYDRPGTTMRQFPMCPRCREEYDDPRDRRFHAQPNACPDCGPHIELWNPQGRVLASHRDALLMVAEALRDGKIAAVKGVGGFHLVADARNQDAVLRLRERKQREEKPFAIMVPTIDTARALCDVSRLEERLLLSPEAPIVLLRKKLRKLESSARTRSSSVAAAVAPGNPYLGLMLPYSPLHHLLLRELGFPVIATSGNLTDEPICIDEHEALKRLGGIADMFLVHNRPIVRHVDDSIVRMVAGRVMVARRARGYAPLPVRLQTPAPDILAVGAHLKSTVAVSRGENVFLSQHLGDLETHESFEAFRAATRDLQALYALHPVRVVHDLHPDYMSSHFAINTGLPVTSIQHHYAHVASCMAENELDGEVLGVAWDGTGLGTDGTLWGGEFLLTTQEGFNRVATFRPFHLPGGSAAIKEPRRTALGLLFEIFGESLFARSDLIPLKAFTPPKLALLRQIITQGVNSPETSSVGRLFDAVASIIGVRQIISFEGQAAMDLEFIMGNTRTDRSYTFRVEQAPEHHDVSRPMWYVNWKTLIEDILTDVRHKVPVPMISAKFHNTLAEVVLDVARRGKTRRVVLSGGCFQNKYLTERTIVRLEAEGFRAYWHQRIPPNDGGIALGQIYAVTRAQSFSHLSQEHQENIA